MNPRKIDNFDTITLAQNKDFLKFIEALQDWVWEMDVEGTHTYSNLAVEDILGYSVDEVVGESVVKLWGEYATQPAINYMKNKLKKAQAWKNVKGKFQHRDGSLVYTESSGHPIFDAKNKLIGYRGVDRDITHKVKLLQSLEESEEKFRVLTQSNPTAILLYQDDKFIFANQAATAITGYSTAELMAQNFWNIVHPEDREMVKKIGEKRQQNLETINNYQFRIIDKSGNLRWLSLFGTTTIINNRPAGIISVLDITRRVDNEKLLAKSNSLLKETSSILRHDIGNDLAVIKSALKLYQQSKQNKMLDEIDKRVEQSLDRIDQHRKSEFFIDHYSRLDLIDLNKTLVEVAENYPELKLVVQGQAHVYADSALKKVFDNLFSNALIHGKADRIEVTISKHGLRYHIEFWDNGIGIPDQIKKSIFEAGCIHGEQGNLGVGLHFVEQTIQSYGGNIYLNPETKEGSKFVIFLNAKISKM
ncbi:MAG: PAS domain S-box protein [Candidatus Cloacimonadales bacterium]